MLWIQRIRILSPSKNESKNLSPCLNPSSQPVEHALDISALLHGDDPQLVLLVDPGQEGFILEYSGVSKY